MRSRRRHTPGQRVLLAALIACGWLALRSAPLLAQTAVPSAVEHATPAQAEPPPIAPQQVAAPPRQIIADDERHSGMYARMSVGIGSMHLTTEFGTAIAFGGSSSFALGYFILPNLALSLDVFGTNAFNIDLPTDSEDASASDVAARTLALGVSLTYYLPFNFYLSVAPGIGWILVRGDAGEPHLDNAAFALDVIGGKEWWMGGSWAIGAGVQMVYTDGNTNVAGVEHTVSLGVLFTVTKN